MTTVDGGSRLEAPCLQTVMSKARRLHDMEKKGGAS